MERPTDTTPEQVNGFWFTRGELRAVWKLSAYSATVMLLALAGSIAIFAAEAVFQVQLFVPETEQALLLVAVLGASVFLQRGIEHKPLADLGLRIDARWIAEAGRGAMYGTALIGLTALALWTGGGVRFEPAQATWEIVLLVLLQGVPIFTLVAMSEELLFRGYPFQLLLTRWGTGWTLAGTSAVFACAHLLNPSIDAVAIGNIFLAGLLLGAAYLAGRSLALPVGMHFAWNFAQATVCGFPVSGLPRRSVLVALDQGPAIITGGAFGPEGGIVATVVLIGGTALLFVPRVRAWCVRPEET